MSKPLIGALILGALSAVVLPGAVNRATAADLQVSPRSYQAADCGPCGCLHVTYDYHREVLTTYGLGFDPRNYDTTQPHYFLGATRAYPHYSCDGDAQGYVEQW
jgi:hypothetical protein